MSRKVEDPSLASRFLQRLTALFERAEKALGANPDRVLAFQFDSSLTGDALEQQTADLESHRADPIAIDAVRAGTVLWPKTLPLPVTVAQALDAVRWQREVMAQELADDVEHAARALVESALLRAVLNRSLIVDRWELPGGAAAPRLTAALPTFSAWVALDLLTRRAADVAGEVDERQFGPDYANGHWPSGAATGEAVTWAQKGAVRLSPDYARKLSEAAAADQPLPDFERPAEEGKPRIRLPAYGLGLLYLATREVDQARRRPIVAIDAGATNHKLLANWRDLPKHPNHKNDVSIQDGIVEILAQGQAIQLSMGLGEANSITESMARALRQMWSWEGLRNWVAFQRLLSVEGSRSGMVRWTLDAHLEALGYARSQRTRETLREKTAKQVERFTEVRISIRDPSGQLREQRPLVLVGSRYERAIGTKWRLDGLELFINPLLYGGVRAENGKLGENWYPAPLELAQVDHVRHPHTIALGLILPIRWRLAMNEGRDHVVISGAKLLEVAGVQVRGKHVGEAWRNLDRDLGELRRIGGLGRWEWDGEPHRMQGMVRLWPSEWLLDRTHREVPIIELPAGPSILTGDELREWRKNQGWSQRELATRLAVNQSTVSRAEKAGAAAIDADLARAVQTCRA